MTRMEVCLSFPAAERQSASPPIRCGGVVVRQQPLPSRRKGPPYLTAVYFSELRAQDRRRIAEFILQRMLAHGHRSP